MQNDSKKDTNSDQNDTSVVAQTDEHFSYIYKKIEKITTALHLITNFFPEDEPLRISIRQKSINLLSEVLRVKEQYVSDTTGSVSFNLSATVREMLSLLQVAVNSGYISEMNHQILERELQSLDSMIGSGLAAAPSPQLSDTYFDVGEAPERTALSEMIESDTAFAIQKPKQQQKQKKKPRDTQKSAQESDKSTSRSSAKKKRRKIILGLFSDMDEITISDVKEVIQGYSTKTIQRDLARLVDEGVLEKHGKRRWTSYRLADN